MRFSRSLLESSCEALREVLALDSPADSVLSRFFRLRRNLGQSDRSTIAETVYAVLRRKRLLERLSGGGRDPRRLALAAWSALLGANLRELEGCIGSDETDWLAQVKRAAREPQAIEVECDMPDWLIARLRRDRDDSSLLELARGLARPAPLDLRINLARMTREAALERFARDGMGAAPTPYSPAGVRIAGKPAINRHELFREGLMEVQDEGSQLLCYLVSPRRGEMVVDFCAGAGGKSLALGMLMRSTGRLYAFDVSDKRLAQLKPRLARSGLSNVHPQRIDGEKDPRVFRLAGKIDRVLIDAPCTGLGTLRRNPDLKWRQSEQSLRELTRKQASILRSAARLAKPGGRLVYATCSVLQEENRDIVAEFLGENEAFRLVSAAQVLAQQRIALDTGEFLELFPHRHGTDGFFAAALERVA